MKGGSVPTVEKSIEMAVRAAIREELGFLHQALMDRDQVIEYLGITKHDLYDYMETGVLQENVHWFFKRKNGLKTRKRKYIPDRCLNAILAFHTVGA